MITARSMTFCNSRMLPGQSYDWSRVDVSLLDRGFSCPRLGKAMTEILDKHGDIRLHARVGPALPTETR